MFKKRLGVLDTLFDAGDMMLVVLQVVKELVVVVIDCEVNVPSDLDTDLLYGI